MQAVKSTAANATRSVKDFSLADLRGEQLKIVEAREADLKEMPSGKDRALAFDQERKQSFWSFSLPQDFKEPVLPDIGLEDDESQGSLLPPKI